MSALPHSEYTPDPRGYISPPGDTLWESAQEWGYTEQRLAKRIGLTIGQLRRLLKGDWPIDEELARQLELAVHVPARFWLARERKYRERLEQRAQQEKLDEISQLNQDMGLYDE